MNPIQEQDQNMLMATSAINLILSVMQQADGAGYVIPDTHKADAGLIVNDIALQLRTVLNGKMRG